MKTSPPMTQVRSMAQVAPRGTTLDLTSPVLRVVVPAGAFLNPKNDTYKLEIRHRASGRLACGLKVPSKKMPSKKKCRHKKCRQKNAVKKMSDF